MAKFMSATDAVAAAVEVERKGHAFYSSARDKAQNKDDRDFFDFMANAELEHEKIFQAMLGRLGGVTLPAGSDDEEYLLYLETLLDTHTLFAKNSENSTQASPLAQALQFEKDSILFFNALERLVPENEKQYLHACVAEEASHIQAICRYMKG